MSTGQLFESGAATAGLAAPVGWPAPPAPAAYTGLAGEIVAAIAPHTEADPVALLAQLLVAFGAAAGRRLVRSRGHPASSARVPDPRRRQRPRPQRLQLGPGPHAHRHRRPGPRSA